MLEGQQVSRWIQRRAALASALLLLLGLPLALTACSSAANDGGARSGSGGWVYGGQTGSLTPSCGLTPTAIIEGVPADSGGFVLHTGDCGAGALELDALTVRDGFGDPVPFDVERLGGDAILVSLREGLRPGSYWVGTNMPFDAGTADDAGSDDDAGIDAAPPGGPYEISQILRVGPEAPSNMPAPTSLGTLALAEVSCEAKLVLTLSPEAQQHAALLALDFSVDDEAVRQLFDYGTLVVEDGVAEIAIPDDVAASVAYGEHILRLHARFAGFDPAPPPLEATFTVPCANAQQPEPMSSGCSVTHPR